jgi:hypothetical protein
VTLPYTLLQILLSRVTRRLWKWPPEHSNLIRREASDVRNSYTKVGNEGDEELAQPQMLTPLLSRPGHSGTSPDMARLEDARGHADREKGSRSADSRNTAPVTAREHLRLMWFIITDLEFYFKFAVPLGVANGCVELLENWLGLSTIWGHAICFFILYSLASIVMRCISSIIYHYFPSWRRTNSNYQRPNDPVPAPAPAPAPVSHDRKVGLLAANIVFSILELSFARLSLPYAQKHLTAERQEPWTKEWTKNFIPSCGAFIVRDVLVLTFVFVYATC